jgi:hypothetical protein
MSYNYVDLPLSMFIPDGPDLIERLHHIPTGTLQEKEDEPNQYENYMKLPTPVNYNPTRSDTPSSFVDEELIPIFGDKRISYYDKYYHLYSDITNHISQKIDEEGEFKYREDIVTDKEAIKSFLVYVVQDIPCTLYDIAEEIGLNEIK